jgi:uridine kinase
MIGENITLKAEYLETAAVLMQHLKPLLALNSKIVVVICGESGSGKTVTAHCLQHVLEQEGVYSALLHMDDYFFLPPQSNHENRLKSLENVGYHEVNLDLIDAHIAAFKNGVNRFEKPLVDYHNNTIGTEVIEVQAAQILLVEGTYTFRLKKADFKVFMSRNYIQTEEKRRLRNRGNEAEDPFNQLVLAKEHTLIAPFYQEMNAIIDFNYHVILP